MKIGPGGALSCVTYGIFVFSALFGYVVHLYTVFRDSKADEGLPFIDSSGLLSLLRSLAKARETSKEFNTPPACRACGLFRIAQDPDSVRVVLLHE